MRTLLNDYDQGETNQPPLRSVRRMHVKKSNIIKLVLNGILGLLCCTFAFGCATIYKKPISSNPSGVSVAVNGAYVGMTPIPEYKFEVEKDKPIVIRGNKEGFHEVTKLVTESDLKHGTILLTLDPTSRRAMLISNPSQATVKMMGMDMGQTPLEYSFDFTNRRITYQISFSKIGYFDRSVEISESSLLQQQGRVNVTLEEDPAWKTTSESEATNTWLRIPVDDSISHESAWQKIIDSVTSVYDSLEQLDQTSGYLRSTPRIKEFEKGPEGPFLIKTQFIGTMSQADPLVYKIKLVSKKRLKRDSDEEWTDFARVFGEEAQLVEELLNRLGLK